MSQQVMDEGTRVWVRTGSAMTPFREVDPRPWTADELGHVWYFDGGASDPDDPRSCALCDRPAWQACSRPCAEGGRLDEVNEERARWIAANRCTRPRNANLAGYAVGDPGQGVAA